MTSAHNRAIQGQSFLQRIKGQLDHSPLNPMGAIPLRRRERPRELVETSRWDKRDWEKKARKEEPIDELIEDLSLGDKVAGGERPDFPMAPYLVEGVFQLFHKIDPQLHDARKIDRELRAAHKIATEMQSNPRLSDLQEYTQGDYMLSVMAVDAMGDQMREIIARVPPPPPPPQPGKGDGSGAGKEGDEGGGGGGGQQGGGGDQEQQGDGSGGGGGGDQGDQGDQQDGGGGGSQGGQGGQDQSQDGGDPSSGGGGGQQGNEGGDPGQPGGGGGEEGEDGPPPPPEERDRPEDDQESDEDDQITEEERELQLDQEYEDAEAEWERMFDEQLADLDLDRLANRALEDAFRMIDELENLRKDIGVEDGVWATMDPTERMALVQQLQTPEMKALADIVGRMKRFSWGVKTTRVIDVPHEAYDVTLGNDILSVLKSQFGLLQHPVTAVEFYRRYAEKELLVYKKRGTEEVGKGPIVACVDKSGSMNGQPFRWAIAVCESLRRFAAEDDRDMFVLIFGNNDDRTRFEFPGGKAPLEKILAFMGTIANGGTQFDGVLEEALDKATNYFDGEGKGKADIIFITDGSANLADSWIQSFNEERARVGVRVFSVYVAGASDMSRRQGPLGLLGRISDITIPVSDLTPESVRDIFTHV